MIRIFESVGPTQLTGAESLKTKREMISKLQLIRMDN